MTDVEELKEEEAEELADMGLRVAEEQLTAQRGRVGVGEREGGDTIPAGVATGVEEEEGVVVWALKGAWLRITCSAGLLGNLMRWWRGRLPGQGMGRCFSYSGEAGSEMSSSASSSESSSSPFDDGGSLIEVYRESSGRGCCGVAAGWRSASVEGEDAGAGL
jgi:hypothetical protein